MYDPTLVNKRERREFCTGYLRIAGKRYIKKEAFTYHAYTPRAYNVLASSMPGFEYVQPTEAIRVTRLDLPFDEGSEVELQDGRTMTVKNIAYQHDNNRAYMTGDPRSAMIITLEGGGK